MTNDALSSLVDTSDAWISKRTGIRNRHIIQSGSSLRDIAVESAKQAIADSGVNAIDIDLVIVATSSPDDLFGDAASVASAIGATNAAAFDLTAACSGFVYGLVTASQFLHSGAYKKVLVVGADALTRFLDWKDRGTCILFGDGSGAMVLEATDSVEESGLLGFALHSDGERYLNLQLRFQSQFESLENDAKTVVDRGQYGKLGMNGPEVYKFAVNEVRG
jgi:3-oxoacyl-[acyl-carrier-protein] synthase-3